MRYEIEIGRNYSVRSGDVWYIGRCIGIVPFGIVLEPCAWIKDTGRRHHEFFADGQPSEDTELEVYPGPRAVRWDEYGEWPHTLFTESL